MLNTKQRRKQKQRARKMVVQLRVWDFILFFWGITMGYAILAETASFEAPPPIAKPNCQSHCGDIEIPYPFGIGEGCYDSNGSNGAFQISCENSTGKSKPFMNSTGLEVLEVSVEGTLRVLIPITFSDCSDKPSDGRAPNLEIVGFKYSQRNRFTSLSCGRVTMMSSYGLTIGGCMSICDNSGAARNYTNTCGGINCCQNTVPANLYQFLIKFGDVIFNAYSGEKCKYAFLVDQDWFTSPSINVSAIGERDSVPVVIEWDPSTKNWTGSNNNSTDCSSGTQCFCSKGFYGNPYLIDGCKGKPLANIFPNFKSHTQIDKNFFN